VSFGLYGFIVFVDFRRSYRRRRRESLNPPMGEETRE
jgi:hypothetical protein